jgi:hypothetical protein
MKKVVELGEQKRHHDHFRTLHRNGNMCRSVLFGFLVEGFMTVTVVWACCILILGPCCKITLISNLDLMLWLAET